MRRAAVVHIHTGARILADEHTGRGSVVEVDVSEQNRVHIGDAAAAVGQRFAQLGQRRRRTGIDHRHPAGALQQTRGDDARSALEVQVGIADARCQQIHVAGLSNQTLHVSAHYTRCEDRGRPPRLMRTPWEAGRLTIYWIEGYSKTDH